MNSFFEKWVVALRSGNYTQGRVCLRSRNDDFCCLGVACDLIKEEYGTPWITANDRWFFDGHYDMPSDDVQQYIADMVDWFVLDIEDFFGDLAAMNDDGKSFEEIADYIQYVEEKYDQYREYPVKKIAFAH